MTRCKLDIAFIVDSSSSIWIKDFERQTSFIHDVVDSFAAVPEDVQIAAVSFSNHVFDEFKFNAFSDRDSILNAVNNIKYSKGDATRTYLAIERMRTDLFAPGNGARDDAVHVAVVLTDGGTNPGSYDQYSTSQGKAKTQEEAELAKQAGIYMFAIGIGGGVDEAELRGIASDPDEKFFFIVDTYDKLDTAHIKSLLACRACRAPTFEFTTTNARRAADARYTRQVSAESAREVCQGDPADIIFILDESTSIQSQENFNKELDFVRDVSDMFDIGPDMTHVSVITYSDESQMRFTLSKYTDKASLEHAIKNIDWSTGNTYTNKALDLLLAQSLSEVRDGVSHIGIVITDGKSTDSKSTKQSAQNVLATGNIEMFAVGIGNAYKPELDIMASKPSEDYVFQIDNLDALESLKNKFAFRICKEQPGCSLAEGCNQYKADIVVVSDASTSIGDESFDKQKGFISSIVEKYNIGPEGVQIGMISYSDDAHTDFSLNTYSTEAEIMTAIENVRYLTGVTYTDKAIEMMTTQGFTSGSGARDGVPKVGIVITDGVSRDQARTQEMARNAKAQGITLFAIGVGSSIDLAELQGIASDPAPYFTFMVDDFASLVDHEDILIKKTCAGPSPTVQTKRGIQSEIEDLRSLFQMLEAKLYKGIGTILSVGINRGEPAIKMWVIYISIVLTLGSLIQPSVEEVSLKGCKLDIAFVVDSSSSIYSLDFDKQKAFLHDFINMFETVTDDVQFAAVSFSNHVFDEFNFNSFTSREDILNAVDNIRYSAGDATRTYLAIERMRNVSFGAGNGAREDAVHIGVVLTDGCTNPGSYDSYTKPAGKKATQQQATMAKSNGIHMFAIGIGDKYDIEEIRGIASDPDEKFVITVDSYSQLDTEHIKELLACRVCRVSTFERRLGKRSLYASLFNHHMHETRASQPYTYGNQMQQVSKCEAEKVCRGNHVDIIFILDESTSIGSPENFRKELNFVRAVSDKFDIGPDMTHVSVITYSNDTQLRFSLNKYTDKPSLEHAIENIDWTTGYTYTNKALDLLLTHSLSEVREGIQHIGIVITDGKSTNYDKTRVSAHNVLATGEIEMFSIGIGAAYKPELDMMASKPSVDYVYQIDDLDALESLENKFAYRVCKEQPGCAVPERCNTYKADIVIVSDASTSISEEDFVVQKQFIASLVDKYNIGPNGVQIGMVSFSTNAHVDFSLNSYHLEKDLKTAIAQVPYLSGDTSTDDALDLMTRQSFTTEAGARAGLPKLAIVITDGSPQRQSRTVQMANKAKAQGITIFAIGIGSKVNMDHLKAIASTPAEYYTFMVDDFASLVEHEDILIKKTCSGQLPVGLSGGSSINQLKCRVDIAFVVDSSSSIWEVDFQTQIRFIEDVVRRFDVSPNDVQFAAVSYSTYVRDEFKFNDNTNQSDVIKDVSKIRYSEGPATRTYKGIERMRKYLFAPGNGARDDAIHVGIILTDGTTNPGGYDKLSSRMGKAETQNQAKLIKDDNTYLFAVGIGSSVNMDELRGIASDPDDTFVIKVDSYNDLNTEKIKEELSYRACYAVTTPRPPVTSPQPITPTKPQKEDPGEVCQGKPADVFFIIDESSSIHNTSNFRLQLSFVEQVIDYLDVGKDVTRVGVMTFSDSATMRFPLNQYNSKDEVQTAVRAIDWRGGNTFTDKALKMLLDEGFTVEMGARKGVAQIGIIVTDGNSTNPYSTRTEAALVHNKGIYMFAIGVGAVYRPELDILASDPNSDFVFTVDNLGALNTIKDILAYRVCKEDQNDSPQEICRRQVADIAFIADASTSIGQADFNKLINFIKEVVDEFDIGVDSTRVGLISFANTSQIEFGLSTYTSSAEVEKALSRVEWRRGLTYTAEALQMMYDGLFADARGGDVPKIGIIITDGNSREPKKTYAMAAEAKKRGIRMFAIGVGQYIVEDELRVMSSDLDSYFMVEDFSSLNSIRQALTTKACKRGKKSKGKRTSEIWGEKAAMDNLNYREIESLIDILKGRQL
ncbi:collagen alpha-3(VI) chain-like [Argopecten irradians]|uniref:collagen alpha-3(VI) chain-like n=1 Tax=Argopecten irradians TaxID=31199 RepID=UPI0037128F67